MVRRRKQDRSLFGVLLPDSDKLWPPWLKRIDTLRAPSAQGRPLGRPIGCEYDADHTGASRLSLSS